MNFQVSLARMINQAYGKAIGWIQGFINMLPNLVVAFLVLVVAWILGSLFSKLVDRAMKRLTRHTEVRMLIAKVAYMGAIAAGIVIALGILKLDKTVASLLAGLGIIGLALGFAFKDIASNFMAGLILTFQNQFTVGDLIKIEDFFGRVEAINLRATVGRDLCGQMVLIPNSKLLEKEIVNYTMAAERRVDISCGVSYGDDLDKVEELAVRAVEELPERIISRPVELFYEEFGQSSVNFSIRFWIKADQKVFLRSRSAAIKTIKKTFDENGITIPFPIRTLEFGNTGGELLADHLRAMENCGCSKKETGVDEERKQPGMRGI